MYNVNLKNINKGKIKYYLFLGISFLVLTGLLLSIYNGIKYKNSFNAKVLSNNVETKSYIDYTNTLLYKQIFHFEVNGKNYICNSNTRSSKKPEDKNKYIYYNANNPEKCIIQGIEKIFYYGVIASIIPFALIIFALLNIIKINKRIKQVEYLKKYGKLIKNLPYYTENANISSYDVHLQKIVVEYKLPTGSTLLLKSDIRYDRKLFNDSGFVDLLIDESNPDNYFIDFDINQSPYNSSNNYNKRK